jgi:hypothetical protein
MAPFTFGPCPRCAAETWQRFLLQEAEDRIVTICETCFEVITHHENGPVECRDATEEERATVPKRVVFSEQQRAEWRKSFEQSRVDIRKWLDAGCPGLTPELERAFPAGWLERVRQFTEARDDAHPRPET